MSIDPPAGAVTGDDEPEDGWDISDPPHVLIANLLRRLELLRIVDDDRNRLRLQQLLEDLAYVRDQLAEGGG